MWKLLFKHSLIGRAAAIAAVLGVAALSAAAATVTVTSTANSGTGSLRGAIASASSTTVDTIVFNIAANDPGCAANVCTIVLSQPLAIDKSVVITGSGSDRLVVSGLDRTPLMIIGGVTRAVDVSISGISFQHGLNTPSTMSGITIEGTGTYDFADCDFADNVSQLNATVVARGAALYNIRGTVNVSNCRFLRNSVSMTSSATTAEAQGGAVVNNGVMNVTGSSFADNTVSSNAVARGGAVFSNGTLSVADSTFTGSILNGRLATRGGAIYAEGALDIRRSTVSGSALTSTNGAGEGGGIYSFRANVSIARTTVSNNTVTTSAAAGVGGGLCNFGGLVTVSSSYISGNLIDTPAQAAANGGGVANVSDSVNPGPTMTISNSAVAGNTVILAGRGTGLGGGIYQLGGQTTPSLTVVNSTIANNSTGSAGSSSGGGIYAGGTLRVTNSTVAGNLSTGVGGIQALTGATVRVRSNIIALNGISPTAPDVSGTFTTEGYNVVGVVNGSVGFTFGPSGPTDLTGTLQTPRDPGLALDQFGGPELAFNGGFTPTVALVQGGAAIDRGAAASGFFTDQRGVSRFQKGAGFSLPTNLYDGTDAGAFEADQCGATGVVTSTADAGPGSLRCELTSNAEGAVITFDPSTFAAATTISLAMPLSIDKSVTVRGPGADLLTLSGSLTRVLEIGVNSPAIDVELSGLTVSGGRATSSASGVAALGGGILFAASGKLGLRESVIRNNTATTSGAATLARGGGIASIGDGTVEIERSTIASNSATAGGGGVAEGGGVWNGGSGTLRLINSTVTLNTAGTNGGGIANDTGAGNSMFFAVAGTVARNTATTGSGGGISGADAFGRSSLSNTIVALNTDAGGLPDLSGRYDSLGYNLVGAVVFANRWLLQTGDQIGTPAARIDPLLSSLGANGGRTPSLRLLAGSPAIDKGKSPGFSVDQRGNARTIDDSSVANAPGGDGTDIGASETQTASSCTANLVDGPWSDRLTWGCGRVPQAGDTAVVSPGQKVFVDQPMTAASVTIKAGGELALTGDFSSTGDIVVEDGGVLNLGTGRLDADGRVVFLSPGASVVSGGGYIMAEVRKTFGGPVAAFTFPVGTPEGYAPVEVANVPGGGTLSVRPRAGAHPNGALGTNRLRRYWTVSNGAPGIVRADVTFNYNDSDVPAGVQESSYRIKRISGSAVTEVAGTIDTNLNQASVPALSSFSDWTLASLVPTAAGATVGGRVTVEGGGGGGGRGLVNATVVLTSPDGATRQTRTGADGEFVFDEVPAGGTYVVQVVSKRYVFAPLVVEVRDSVGDIAVVGSKPRVRTVP